MSLRVKLLLLFTLAVAAAAGVTAWNAERYAQQQFQQADQERSDALVAQFRRELSEREAEVTARVQTIADAESTVRMVLELSGPQADPSLYSGDARGLAAARQLDFLELASNDGTVISSAQWPDHVGMKNNWVTHENDWNQRGAFLDRVELPDRLDLGVVAVRIVHAGSFNLYIIGGRRLDSSFLQTLSLPAGMRALLYRNLDTDFVPAALSDADGPVAGAESFAPLIESLQKQSAADQAIPWSADSGNAEKFVSVPLTGKQGEFLGALLLGSAQGQWVALQNDIRGSAFLVAAAGMILALFLSWWLAARIARPLARLSEGIAEVSAGDWDAQVDAGAVREVQQAIGAFNKMTKQLADERAAQVARERAAAWRQLAGQLAAELKTLLPPLQKTVQSLARPPQDAASLGGEDTLETADEFEPEISERIAPASAAVQQTIETLAACAGKLGEFASLPVPRLEAVNVNDAVRAAVQTFEPQFSAIGRPPITPELFLDERAGQVRADPVLLRSALENLLLFVLEDMPAGGTFSITTRRQDGMAHMIVSHNGSGASTPRRENRNRTLDRAARVSGIGLSLATVQSIVSSHGGKIAIESAPLAGTTFYLDWPVASPASSKGAAAQTVPEFPTVLQNQTEPETHHSKQPESPKQQEPKQREPKHQENDQPLASPAQPQASQPPTPQPPTPETRDEPKQQECQDPPEQPKELQNETTNKENERQETLEVIPAEPQPQAQLEAPNQPQAQVQLQAEAQLHSLQELERKLDSSPLLAAAADEAPESQLESVAAEPETRELAAVIEEVIETSAYAARRVSLFAGERGRGAGELELTRRSPIGDSLIELSVVGIADEKTEAARFHSSEDAPPVPAPELFGIPMPAAQTVASADAPSSVPADSSPQLFGIAVPASALETTQEAPSESPAARQEQETAAENRVQSSPESAVEPAPPPSKESATESSNDHTKHEDTERASPRVAYSPLTYRW